MIFKATKFKESFEIEPELREDDRGYFYRNFAIEEVQKNVPFEGVKHINRGFSRYKGTLRGLHYQIAPKSECKIIQAISGSFFDVLLDLRPDSPTYRQWQTFELSSIRKNMLIVPKGFANGIQTLEDGSELQYFVDEVYSPEYERGIRYNDPQFNFPWPLGEPTVISDKDKSWPDFQ
jgi:dTDP-4-dehydrorhamnose 3,5-epimerase